MNCRNSSSRERFDRRDERGDRGSDRYDRRDDRQDRNRPAIGKRSFSRDKDERSRERDQRPAETVRKVSSMTDERRERDRGTREIGEMMRKTTFIRCVLCSPVY